jgi:hypothetical protein
MNKRTPEGLNRQVETLELINNEVTATLAAQYDSAARIDTKAAILVGYAGAAASFLATRHARPVLAALAYVAFGVAVGFGISAYAVFFYENVPKPRRLFNRYLGRTKPETLAALAATRVKVIERNAHRIHQKVKRWWISLGTLTIGMVFMISAIATVRWIPPPPHKIGTQMHLNPWKDRMRPAATVEGEPAEDYRDTKATDDDDLDDDDLDDVDDYADDELPDEIPHG